MCSYNLFNLAVYFYQETEAGGGQAKPSSLERLAYAALEALELGAGASVATVAVTGTDGGAEAARKLLCAPASAFLHARAQCLLRAVYGNQYHQCKVRYRLPLSQSRVARKGCCQNARRRKRL